MRLLIALSTVISCLTYAQLLRNDKMNLGVYNHETKHYEKQNLLGSDNHDRIPHGMKHLLGSGNHDRVPHGVHLLGSGDHDRVPHGVDHSGDGHNQEIHPTHMLGEDGHDNHPHTNRVLGGDGHDNHPHHKPLLGSGDHDLVPHGTHLLGGDDHDKIHHSKKFGSNRERKAHKKRTFGREREVRKQKHAKKLLGAGIHDLGHMGVFKSFMKQHNKVYQNQGEFKHRFNIFRQNMKKVYILQQNERGSAKYGATKFADLTEHEFSQMLGLRPDKKPETSSMVPAEIPDIEAPVEFDWRDKGAVTPIKNQGMCGSCWAFSVTGNVEGQWAIKHQHLYSLSEQELVDCDKTDEGCNGGMPENAYEAIKKLGGLESENDYPYDGKDEQCHFNRSMVKVTVNGSVELPQDETDLAKWLVQSGPISIGINANALQFYVGGVSHPLKFLCNPKNLDHGMLIVGYGVHTTKYLHRKQPYWIVKNSWGSDWGEQGYYRVYRGDGTCGVNQMATSAIVP
ncbi:hypothetical protein SK128_005710 [Halocaridina rubra]|uniref:Uncharacterized protein n=1 Tax=Halocaridina rubra TaxID=373956 RepID=A0AAN9AD86_HALRR